MMIALFTEIHVKVAGNYLLIDSYLLNHLIVIAELVKTNRMGLSRNPLFSLLIDYIGVSKNTLVSGQILP